MKSIFIPFFLIVSLSTAAQEKKAAISYLTAPGDWRKELLTLPLSFAPELDYTGLEDVRFSKGWGDKNSDEFWTYKFAWYLDIDPKLGTEKIENELKFYFDGLMNAVGQGRKIPKEKIKPTLAIFVKDSPNHSFKGKVHLFDVFFTKDIIKLNVIVKPAYCEVTKKHIVYFEFSPQSFDHALWKTMEQIQIPCK